MQWHRGPHWSLETNPNEKKLGAKRMGWNHGKAVKGRIWGGERGNSLAVIGIASSIATGAKEKKRAAR